MDTLIDSIRVVDVLVLDVPALGRRYRTEGRSVAFLDRALRLRDVNADVDGDGERFELRAQLTDTALHVTLGAEGDSQSGLAPPPRPTALPSLVPLRLAFGGELRPGNVVTMHVFDPFTVTTREATVRVAAESTLIVADSADYDSTTMAWVPVRFDTVRATRIDLADPVQGSVSAWIDGQGRLVRAVAPLGYTVERTAFELAYENFRHRDTLRLIRASAASAPGEVIPATAIAAGVRPDSGVPAVLRVRLGAVPFDGLDLDGGRQRRLGDTLVVERETPSRLRARFRPFPVDPALRGYLGPELLAESGDLRIAAQARQVVERERDAARVAARLAHWVATEVRPAAATGVPSALAVLARRRGDCNEHTMLYVAMARALGLPARPVAGLLWAHGRFYHHAWAEVWLGDWVAVDPTFDQFPADAAHLRFVIGGLARQAELVRRLGRLTLEVI